MEVHAQVPDELPLQVASRRHCGIGFGLVLDTAVPQLGREPDEQVVDTLQGQRQGSTVQAPAPVVQFISPSPAVCQAPAPVVENTRAGSVSIASCENLSPAPAVFQAPSVEYFAPAPVAIQSPTPVVEHISPSPAVFQAPTAVERDDLQRSVPGQSSTARCGAVSAQAEAEELEDENVGEQLERRYPDDWAAATAPDGRAYFWHRLSVRVRWTLTSGASCGVKRKK